MDGSGAIPRVAFLGFDAGSPRLVREWAAAGHLPNFARILARGATATVEHEPGVLVGSVWPTALTGVGVARHGFYTGIRPAPFSYDYIAAGPLVDPFWVEVARAGRRIWVADTPFFHPVEDLGGAQLFEWGCHDRYHGPGSHPPELLGQVERDVGRHPLGMMDHPLGYDRFAPCDWVHLTDGRRDADQVVAFVELLHDAIDHRARLGKYRRNLGPFDLTVDVVAETHCAGHHLWSAHDVDHPDHDPVLSSRLGGDPLLEVYRRMDDLLGSHLESLGDDGLSYVLLSHGMRAHFEGTHLLDEILWRLDQAYRGEPTPWVGPMSERAARLLDRLPARTRPQALAATGHLARRRLAARSTEPTTPLPVPHPSQRLWFQLENNTVSGAVRFNRVGREPQGLLSEAMTRHAARWLERELLQLVNVDTGGPVVDSVHLADLYYARRLDDGLPDVFVEWVRDHPIDAVWSPTIGFIRRPYEGLRTGDHESAGELIVTGPGVIPGRVGEVRPTDLAPTVAAAAGVALRDVDGEPVPGLLPAHGEASERTRRARLVLDVAPPRRSLGPARDAVDLRHELIELRRTVEALQAAHHETRQLASAAASRADVATEILATTSWIRQARVATDLRISVVMPTCGRRRRLERAVASVLEQTHRDLELVVVDDASDDSSAEWLAGIDDPRVVVVRNDQRLGEGASRNRALDVASGDVLAFLDDDNTFEPDWLRSLAWTFTEHPAVDVVYGARLVDDVRRHHRLGDGGLPWLQLNDWDRSTMRERCLVDVNTVAHRRSDARFDPELVVFTDWDYLLALTVETDPLRLPVVAAHYTTDAPSRASSVAPDVETAMYERVRARWGTW